MKQTWKNEKRKRKQIIKKTQRQKQQMTNKWKERKERQIHGKSGKGRIKTQDK